MSLRDPHSFNSGVDPSACIMGTGQPHEGDLKHADF